MKETTLEQLGPEPELEMITTELDTALRDAGVYLEQYEFDYKTRFCLWEGQSRDGKKWDRELGGQDKAKPWNGASDVRTFTADEIIIEQVETMMGAWARANIQVTAMQSTSLGWSSKITTLLQWLLRDQMAAECARELELAAQWRQTYGVAVMGVWWHQERRIEKVRVTLQELEARGELVMQQTGSDLGLQLVDAVMDPLQEEWLIEQLILLSPVVDRRAARRLLKGLREDGEGILPRVYVAENQPCWEALRPFWDVFFPIETCSLQKDARWMARARWMTETDLAVKRDVEGWDPEWCETVLQHRGRAYSSTELQREFAPRAEYASLTSVVGHPNGEHYTQVFDVYTRGIDSESGMPVVYRTVMSPFVKDSYGWHEPFDYHHGKLPAIEMVRERIERPMLESRSIPEIAATPQNTIKTQRDATNDFAQMSTIPTLLVPMWRSGTRLGIGPAAQIPERTQGELRFLQPQWNGVAERIEENTEVALARYFGRRHERVPADRQQLATAHLVTKWLGEVTEVVRMTMQLWQQYGSDVEVERNVGPMKVPFRVSREEIQGGFNMRLSLDPNDLNFDLAIRKLEAFNKFVLPIDTQGAVSRAELVRFAAQMVDPYLAEQIVGTPETAAQSEIEDEQKNLVSILSGVEPPMRPEGQNYALRLQVLQQLLGSNPILPQLVEQRPDVQAMLRARMEHLQHMAVQFGANREIGRVGAEPGLVTLQQQMEKGVAR